MSIPMPKNAPHLNQIERFSGKQLKTLITKADELSTPKNEIPDGLVSVKELEALFKKIKTQEIKPKNQEEKSLFDTVIKVTKYAKPPGYENVPINMPLYQKSIDELVTKDLRRLANVVDEKYFYELISARDVDTIKYYFKDK